MSLLEQNVFKYFTNVAFYSSLYSFGTWLYTGSRHLGVQYDIVGWVKSHFHSIAAE